MSWEIHLKGFEKFEKDFEFRVDEDFFFVIDRKTGKRAYFTHYFNPEEVRNYLENYQREKNEFSKELYKLYRDSD